MDHNLKTLVLSYQPLIAIDSQEETRAIRRVNEVAKELNLPVFEWSVTEGLCRDKGHAIDGRTSDPAMALAHIQSLRISGVFIFKDLNCHFDDPRVVRGVRDVCSAFRYGSSVMIVVGSNLEMPARLRQDAVFWQMDLPTRQEIDQILVKTVETLNMAHSFKIAVNAATRDALVNSLMGLTEDQVRQAISWTILMDGSLDKDDVEHLSSFKADLICEGGLLELTDANRSSASLGGFGNLRAWLKRARLGFSKEAREMNLDSPKGVMLVGVQGCGKSLAAKVIAKTWGMPLLKLDAGRLYDKYIGETEKNLHKATELAEAISPCVLWIDEMEKAFAGSSGGGSTDGGVSQRVLGSFLTWMQEKDESVFLVATSNDLETLPPELLRKGRFDEIFFVDLPTENERREIFKIHLKKHDQDTNRFPIDDLARATDRFSGAEIEQAVISALYQTLESKRPLDGALLLEEIGSTKALAISRREDIERLRDYARERFVPVSAEE